MALWLKVSEIEAFITAHPSRERLSNGLAKSRDKVYSWHSAPVSIANSVVVTVGPMKVPKSNKEFLFHRLKFPGLLRGEWRWRSSTQRPWRWCGVHWLQANRTDRSVATRFTMCAWRTASLGVCRSSRMSCWLMHRYGHLTPPLWKDSGVSTFSFQILLKNTNNFI